MDIKVKLEYYILMFISLFLVDKIFYLPNLIIFKRIGLLTINKLFVVSVQMQIKGQDLKHYQNTRVNKVLQAFVTIVNKQFQ